ncbi:uncharacterized protein ARMOST_01581 [Armillaria ostoyae]|uniref:Integral membrane protein n=1 Tax=Armillaria ostoyae TaxID=47428 RepID=A0A284QPC6_ARMOS|nr:uncharacterized protein ARMOST_01581 [Armillaria ostoyae]
MATQSDVPPGLTDHDRAFIYQYLDANLNCGILYALLHGIYTGILAVTLWNIFINKCWPIRRAMVVVIILLHALVTINFAATWSFTHSAFIDYGKTFLAVFSELNGDTQATVLVMGIASSMSTILADLFMMWYCWMVWGRCWLIILLPILFLISGTISRIIELYHQYDNQGPTEIFQTLYVSFILATTLWCTLFIIYRIFTIAGVKRGAEGRLRVFHHFIEVLVASSALYSIFLILDLAFVIQINLRAYYVDVIATIAKGTAPTLLVGRITTGHRARPDDSWQGSVIASASIRSQEQEHSRTSSQEDRPTSLVLDGDLEAQRESGVREPSPTFFPGPSAQSQGVMTLPKFEHFPLYHLGDTEDSIRSVAYGMSR